jgi:hypothetical protein
LTNEGLNREIRFSMARNTLRDAPTIATTVADFRLMDTLLSFGAPKNDEADKEKGAKREIDCFVTPSMPISG